MGPPSGYRSYPGWAKSGRGLFWLKSETFSASPQPSSLPATAGWSPGPLIAAELLGKRLAFFDGAVHLLAVCKVLSFCCKKAMFVEC